MTRDIGTSSFNPSRLDLARRYRGLDEWSLAQRLGIKLTELVRYRKGKTEPGEPMIERFAMTLHFPSAWFYGPTLEEPDPYYIH